jgi:chromate transporter
VGGGLLAALVAFAPSFAFILIGADRFDRLVRNPRARAFLGGSAPAAIGAIIGSAIPLTSALSETWQYFVLAGAAVWLLALRWGVVSALLLAGLAGALAALAGAPLPA